MNLKTGALLLLVGSMGLLAGGCSRGWEIIECWDSGKLVYKSQWESCPTFAGRDHAKLANGAVVKAQCICTHRL
jgi:hypothetical protein